MNLLNPTDYAADFVLILTNQMTYVAQIEPTMEAAVAKLKSHAPGMKE